METDKIVRMLAVNPKANITPLISDELSSIVAKIIESSSGGVTASHLRTVLDGWLRQMLQVSASVTYAANRLNVSANLDEAEAHARTLMVLDDYRRIGKELATIAFDLNEAGNPRVGSTLDHIAARMVKVDAGHRASIREPQ